MAKHKNDKAKPAKTGGIAAPFDYVDGTDQDVTGVLAEFKDDALDGSELTALRTQGMVALVSKGVPIPVSAQALGINSNTWKQWARNARNHKEKGMKPGFGEGQSRYLYWLEAMDTARASFEATAVCCIYNAAATDWKAALALLERRASKRWHLQSKLVLETQAKEKVTVTTMSTAHLIALAKGLLPAEDIQITPALPSGDVSDAELLDDEIASDD